MCENEVFSHLHKSSHSVYYFMTWSNGIAIVSIYPMTKNKSIYYSED